jgi:hypothetical protein
LLRGANSSNNGWDAWASSTNYDPHVGHNSDWYMDDMEIWDGLPTGSLIPHMNPPQ